MFSLALLLAIAPLQDRQAESSADSLTIRFDPESGSDVPTFVKFISGQIDAPIYFRPDDLKGLVLQDEGQWSGSRRALLQFAHQQFARIGLHWVPIGEALWLIPDDALETRLGERWQANSPYRRTTGLGDHPNPSQVLTTLMHLDGLSRDHALELWGDRFMDSRMSAFSALADPDLLTMTAPASELLEIVEDARQRGVLVETGAQRRELASEQETSDSTRMEIQFDEIDGSKVSHVARLMERVLQREVLIHPRVLGERRLASIGKIAVEVARFRAFIEPALLGTGVLVLDCPGRVILCDLTDPSSALDLANPDGSGHREVPEEQLDEYATRWCPIRTTIETTLLPEKAVELLRAWCGDPRLESVERMGTRNGLELRGLGHNVCRNVRMLRDVEMND